MRLRRLFQHAKCYRERNVKPNRQSLDYFASVGSLGKLGQQTSEWICITRSACGAFVNRSMGWTQLAKSAAAGVLSGLTRDYVCHLNPGQIKNPLAYDGSGKVFWVISLLLEVSILVKRGRYLTALLPLLFWGAGGLYSHQVVLGLSLSLTPLRMPAPV